MVLSGILHLQHYVLHEKIISFPPVEDKRQMQDYHADLQDFLRATGYLPKNTEPAPLGKIRRIPIISGCPGGCRQVD
jgi:hypothetical protein